MAKKLKVGDVIHGYRITKVFGPGMMAISYGALSTDGRKVFFKQYKSPSPAVVWYDAFLNYQRELSSRVGSGRASHFAVRQVDAFEEIWGGPCYFQAYEFVENGADLQHMLDDERERHRLTKSAPAREPLVWARHVTWAKVLMAGIASLHEVRVVHADLKPANAYLIEDPTIGAGYQLKLIDMDFSLLSDRRAPWHGHQGYVGTDNYRSPEHLTRGNVPGPSSDVFTCGLMLYELLAGNHPYWSDDQSEYARKVKAYEARPPALLGSMPGPVSNAEVSAALHRCLSPEAAARPSAAELRAILSGRGGKPAVAKAPSRLSGVATDAGGVTPPAPASVAAKAARAGGEALASAEIEFQGPDGRSLRIGVRTELGRSLVRQFGADSEFWDDRQCIVERLSGQQWFVRPVAGTTNETLVNGETLTAARALRQGDVLAVGRQAKGVSKLPLAVRSR